MKTALSPGERHPLTETTPRVIVVRGVIERGDQRGREIGFATANIALPGQYPRDGVWAGWLQRQDGFLRPTAVSIGRRSTFYGRDGIRLLEAHVLDFEGSLYDEAVVVYLGSKIRGQRRFASMEELVVQIHDDVAAARTWCDQPASEAWRCAAEKRPGVLACPST